MILNTIVFIALPALAVVIGILVSGQKNRPVPVRVRSQRRPNA